MAYCSRCGRAVGHDEVHYTRGTAVCVACSADMDFEDEMGMCRRCGVIIPRIELRMLDTWWLCSYCFNDITLERREAEERKRKALEKERFVEVCARCGRGIRPPVFILPGGESVCEECFGRGEEGRREVSETRAGEEKRKEGGIGGGIVQRLLRVLRVEKKKAPRKVVEIKKKKEVRKKDFEKRASEFSQFKDVKK
ncbi:MAG: hypothetical protein AB1468_00205 [Candidatus Micrarchaeota archaeon]